MEVWQDGVARLSSDLLGVEEGVRGPVWAQTASRRAASPQAACQTRQKVLDVVSFSGSRVPPHLPPPRPFTAKLEQYWENGTGAYNEESGLFTQPSLGP